MSKKLLAQQVNSYLGMMLLGSCTLAAIFFIFSFARTAEQELATSVGEARYEAFLTEEEEEE